MSSVMVRTTVSPEEFGQRVREMVERVEQGELAAIESAGRQRAVLLDATDYRLLRALAACASDPQAVRRAMKRSALRTSRLFGISSRARSVSARLPSFWGSPGLMIERFRRLDVPLGLGPSSREDALAEIAVARSLP